MKARRIEKVFLYDEGAAKELDIEKVAEYLKEQLGKVQVKVRENPFVYCPEESPDYARKLASIKIQDASRKIALEPEPLYGEVEYEKRRLMGKTRAFGILYDGLHLLRVFSRLIARQERALCLVHIFFTNRLFATWEENDRRYHARTSVYGIPSIISTTGLIEAPAKPREYYLLKQQYERWGKDLTELKDRFKGRFIDYEDKRLTDVAKGYAMQAVFYSLIGNPFCEDKDCRLYNAHWQEELIFAQLESGYEFCQRHTGLIEAENRH